MLTDSRVVMIWRRVSGLERTKNLVESNMAWPLVGEDDYTLMYDAGGALVGFATRWEFPAAEAIVGQDVIPELESPGRGATPLRLMSDEVCSAVSLREVPLIANPAAEVRLAPAEFPEAVERVSRRLGVSDAPVTDEAGDTFRFLEEDGNVFSFYQPSQELLTDYGAGEKLQNLLNNRRTHYEEADRSPEGIMPAPLVSLSLLVSDVNRSRQFYDDALGLRVLDATEEEVTFDVGTLTLSIRREPTKGMVRSLSKVGRFVEDWIVFHVQDINNAASRLLDNGVRLPAGVERSEVGPLAYFTDPDGHYLSIWEPSEGPTNITYQPIVDRILDEEA